MRARYRTAAFVALAFSGAIGCGALVGVDFDQAHLQDEAGAEAGPASSEEGGAITSGDAAGPACVGTGCPCTGDVDCADSSHHACVAGKCSECAPTPVDTCSGGQYCNATSLTCVAGCKGDSDCAANTTARRCDVGNHRCLDCIPDGGAAAGCTAPQTCTASGACAEPCSGACSGASLVCCESACIDPQKDAFNCGSAAAAACGHVCTGTNPQCCGGGCVDLATNTANCGSCGLACSTVGGTPTCSGDACGWTCNANQAHCATGNTGCETDLATSAQHCGSCTKSCTNQVLNASGVACVASACTYAACSAGFVDKNGNKADGCETACGVLNQPCCGASSCTAANTICTAGACKACGAANSNCAQPSDCCSGACELIGPEHRGVCK